MADESPKSVANGVLGHLPPWPRPALNNSVIGMEQAYRQRKNLPLLTDEDIAALKAGEQMPWERGETSAPAASPAPAAPPASATPPAPAAASASAEISPEVAAIVAAGKKWSRSTVAAEQARRNRKGLPALNDAEVTALLGEPATPAAAPAPAAAASAARPAAPAAARPAAAQATVASASARGTEANTYVGTPAVGTSKAAAAGGVASVGPDDSDVNQGRRRFVWTAVAAFLMAWFIAFFRFFLPRTLFEPATSFKIGYPADYGLGVDTKWQQKYRIWVDRTPDRMFVIYARCTHLGCTPDWKPSENKFKCPCHGSGYDSEGVNFEGPAPRPMDRAHVDIAPDGQILVDVSRLYQWPKGQPSRFNDPGAYLPV
jgi:cytochrome b6-f complex iron-sulfur subunit